MPEASRSLLVHHGALLAEREKVHGQATAAAIERVASVISGTEKVGKINTLAASRRHARREAPKPSPKYSMNSPVPMLPTSACRSRAEGPGSARERCPLS